MDRDIFLTASFWAWAHGVTGVIATAGVVIASTVVVEEDTSPDVDTTVDMAHLLYAQTAVEDSAVVPPYVLHMAQQGAADRPAVPRRAVAHPMVALMPQQRAVAALTVVGAANTASR